MGRQAARRRRHGLAGLLLRPPSGLTFLSVMVDIAPSILRICVGGWRVTVPWGFHFAHSRSRRRLSSPCTCCHSRAPNPTQSLDPTAPIWGQPFLPSLSFAGLCSKGEELGVPAEGTRAAPILGGYWAGDSRPAALDQGSQALRTDVSPAGNRRGEEAGQRGGRPRLPASAGAFRVETCGLIQSSWAGG